MEFKSFMEALKGKQHKIDKNKNGKVDAHDFELLRKEETEELDEIHRMKTKLNKLDPISNKSVARQKLSNLMKSGKARGALIANKMRTLNMGDDLDQEDLDALHEVLSKDAKAGDWISDFVHSTNPKFDGKSKKERINMALGAYYDTHKKKDGISEQAPVAPVPDRKYIKGTPEHKAYKATKKPINGMPTNEEVEQIDEISKATLGSYVKKAATDARINSMIGKDFEHKAKTSRKPSMKDASTELSTQYKSKAWKRSDNIAKAVDRLTKEEVEQIDEVSSSEVDHHFHQWTNSEHAPYNSDAGDDNKVHQSALSYLRSTNVPKEKHEKMAMHIANKFHGSGIDEEVEELDELHPLTYMSYHNKATAIGRDGTKAFDKSGKDRSANIEKADKRVTDSAHGKGPLAKLYPTGKKSTLGKKAQAAVRSNAQWNEEAEELEEKSDQAKQNKTMKNMMDASRGARYKLNNPVPDAEPEHKTAQAHNKAIGRALRNEDKMTTTKDKSGKLVSFKYEGDWKKSTEKKEGSGKAANLAGQAMQKMKSMSEEKDEEEYGYEGDMAMTQLETAIRHATHLKGMMKPDTDLPEWVQSKITLATDYLQTAADYIHSEMNEAKSVEVKVNHAGDEPHEEKWEPVKKIKKPVAEAVQKADIPAYLRKAKGDTPLKMDDLKRKDTLSDAENLKRNRGVKESFDDEGNLIPTKISYKDFITEIKLADLPVRRIQGHSYGANYSDPEGADDADDNKPMKPAAEKRGRGRPAGAKSGARKITGTSKLMNK